MEKKVFGIIRKVNKWVYGCGCQCKGTDDETQRKDGKDNLIGRYG